MNSEHGQDKGHCPVNRDIAWDAKRNHARQYERIRYERVHGPNADLTYEQIYGPKADLTEAQLEELFGPQRRAV